MANDLADRASRRVGEQQPGARYLPRFRRWLSKAYEQQPQTASGATSNASVESTFESSPLSEIGRGTRLPWHLA